jgi:hypothetical protein
MGRKSLENQIAALMDEQKRRDEMLRGLLAVQKKEEREFQAEVDRIVGRALRDCADLQPLIREKMRTVKSQRERELLVRAGLIAVDDRATGTPVTLLPKGAK